jgi:hypothetical protein
MWFYPWITAVILNAALAVFISLPLMGLWGAFFAHMMICGALVFYMEHRLDQMEDTEEKSAIETLI